MSRHLPPDDTEPLDDALLGLIVAERRHPGPGPGTDARVKAAVLATVAVGAAVGSAAAAATSAAAASMATSATATTATTATAATTSAAAGVGAVGGFSAVAKSSAIIVAALAATAGGSLFVATYASDPPAAVVETATVSTPPPGLVVEQPTTPPADVDRRRPARPAPDTRPKAPPVNETPQIVPPSETATIRPETKVDGDVDVVAMAAERAVLIEARAALTHDDPQTALVALEAHRDGWPDGRLVEEREALVVMALAKAGQAAPAQAAAIRFRARYPRSLFLDAVEKTVAPTP